MSIFAMLLLASTPADCRREQERVLRAPTTIVSPRDVRRLTDWTECGYHFLLQVGRAEQRALTLAVRLHAEAGELGRLDIENALADAMLKRPRAVLPLVGTEAFGTGVCDRVQIHGTPDAASGRARVRMLRAELRGPFAAQARACLHHLGAASE